jgi:5'-phosphate synthase pdxT subunit
LKKIGVLALQGDFEKHRQILITSGCNPCEVRTADQLNKTDALIIPGGESTTFAKLFDEFNLHSHIQKYAQSRPVLGTCAGLIVLAKKVENFPYPTLGLINITVKRNAYGRQKESFVSDIQVNLIHEKRDYLGIFIRAPKIIKYGNNVEVLAKYNNDIIMVMSKNILACTFHPELTNDPLIHKFFINTFL